MNKTKNELGDSAEDFLVAIHINRGCQKKCKENFFCRRLRGEIDKLFPANWQPVAAVYLRFLAALIVGAYPE